MLDPHLIRHDLEKVAAALKKRNMEFDVEALRSLEEKRRVIQMEAEALRAERNLKSKQIGELKARGEDAQHIVDGVADIKRRPRRMRGAAQWY